MSKILNHHLAVTALVCIVTAARGADSPAAFLGAQSCASTSCHGGGGAKQSQFLAWSLKDFHSQRPAATLTTARSRQIAEALEMKNPAADLRCTSCHAPLGSVLENLRGDNFKPGEGVSCESCHGAAGDWIRSHTRIDYSHADRVASGMRDLENLYVRANTCVACHQNVDAKILAAGHPELIFELDGQSVAEPKHWSVEKNGNGAQAWLVGQAVALRELSWQRIREHSSAELSQQMTETNLLERIYALSWLLSRATGEPLPPATTMEDFESQQRLADKLAREKSRTIWTTQATHECLLRLASLAPDFADPKIPRTLQARRAERLVLALDRLTAAEDSHQSDAELDRLFKLAQSLPDFDPQKFAEALEKFSNALPRR